ncbi:MAG: hypothetical protein M1839_004780 [Geoglossum umbratile]|nr:MAG: hypothetical protein M1839_004780 [Geoglossum umbratile]
MSRLQRYFIALTIASAHLQLHFSPWISSYWTKKDILFLRGGDDPNTILINQPYISRGFSHGALPRLNPNTPDCSVTNLGIMLLELCFGTALEDHQAWQKYCTRTANGEPNRFLKLAAALEWCSMANEEAGLEFQEATLWCLHNSPRCGVPGEIIEKNWKEEMFVKVVEPLQYCHNQLSGAMVSSPRLFI